MKMNEKEKDGKRTKDKKGIKEEYRMCVIC